ncbi:dihydroorotase [Streptomyces sp. NPDC001793]|uniref:dihydroorotase n=1 Tax=Streptomyces sp. NPDC001793 TaxID=3154657 RepID=UPI003329FD6E
MKPLVVRGVRPYCEEPVDIRIADGRIAEIGHGIDAADADELDRHGLIALPGFVDLHARLGEPDDEEAETLESGSAAAALGGYTAVFAMADGDPVADNPAVVCRTWQRGQSIGLVDVHPVGAVTHGLRGEALAEISAMARSDAGVRVFSDGGRCVADPLLMRRALEYATSLDVVIVQRPEEHRLTEGAQAHEGANAARLGLSGWPAAAEEVIVARDALLAEQVGAGVHFSQVSAAGTTRLLHWAKHQGIRVTAEVSPHHLLLTDDCVGGYDPVFKVNPPLRSAVDVHELRHALAQGVVDCVATGHSPCPPGAKEREWTQARAGALGLQTALSVVVKAMVHTGHLDWRGVARVMSERPARIAGLADHGRPIAVGEPANLALVDGDAQWTVQAGELESPGANSPYVGMTLPATLRTTFLRGRITADAGRAIRLCTTAG